MITVLDIFNDGPVSFLAGPQACLHAVETGDIAADTHDRSDVSISIKLREEPRVDDNDPLSARKRKLCFERRFRLKDGPDRLLPLASEVFRKSEVCRRFADEFPRLQVGQKGNGTIDVQIAVFPVKAHDDVAAGLDKIPEFFQFRHLAAQIGQFGQQLFFCLTAIIHARLLSRAPLNHHSSGQPP